MRVVSFFRNGICCGRTGDHRTSYARYTKCNLWQVHFTTCTSFRIKCPLYQDIMVRNWSWGTGLGSKCKVRVSESWRSKCTKVDGYVWNWTVQNWTGLNWTVCESWHIFDQMFGKAYLQFQSQFQLMLVLHPPKNLWPRILHKEIGWPLRFFNLWLMTQKSTIIADNLSVISPVVILLFLLLYFIKWRQLFYKVSLCFRTHYIEFLQQSNWFVFFP